MKYFIYLLLLIPSLLIGQVAISSSSATGNTYTLTNVNDDLSIKAVGTTLFVANPFYKFKTATVNDSTPDVSNVPVIKISNTATTDIDSLIIVDDSMVALLLLYFTTDYTDVINSDTIGNIECITDLSFQTGDLAFAFWTGSEWYVWAAFLKD